MIFRDAFAFAAAIGILCLLTAAGCSNNNGDSILGQPDDEPLIQAPGREAQSGRLLWGVWQFTYDESTNELTPIPLREAYAHFNITPMLLPPNCNDCLKIKVNSFDTVTRILDADVTLRNPTSITGHDVRGILYTNDYGHSLTNADDWTAFWDITGGQTINPFIAFAKSVDHRAFAPGFEDTGKYLIYIPIPPHWEKITFAADASWPGNCKEPYGIENFIQSGELYETTGATCDISVDVLDWQNDVDGVQISVPEITGDQFTYMVPSTGNTWTVLLANNKASPAGCYPGLIMATSSNSASIKLYDYVAVTITETAQPAGWARTWGGDSGDSGNGVVVDGSGNIFIMGGFAGTVDFDPGDGTDEHTSNGSGDIFLSKFDSSGNFKWVRTWGGDSGDSGNGVAVDDSGNIFITGSFAGTVDFDPGDGANDHTSNDSADVFLSKFDSSGNFQWARTWGGMSDWDQGSRVAIDGSGNAYVTGRFGGTVDFDPGPGTDEHSSNGKFDIFLSKFDSNGEFRWARTWGGVSDGDWSSGVAIDGTGSAYVTGWFSGTIDFDPGLGVDEHTSNGQQDAFLSKFGLNGGFQWACTWGGDNSDMSCAIAIDGNNNIYITGDFAETVDFDPGPGTDNHTWNGYYDIFISKFNSDGVFQWALTWGGDNFDMGAGVASDVNGNAYIMGLFGSTVDFDSGPGVDEHTALGDYRDIFLAKFDSTGEFQWARTWGGDKDDHPCGVAVDVTSNAYITGYFEGSVDFDPSPGVDEHTSNGGLDIFLSRFPPDGNW